MPDGDLFEAISAGRASMVTDRVERFVPGGIRLESGRELEADIVVLATGLNLLALGGVALAVDGEPVSLPDRLAYKGMMLSGVPNFAFTIGYTNASWTLKADLVAEYVCRLLARMDREGYRHCVPVDDASVERAAAAGLRRRLRPALDPRVPEGRGERPVAARHELRAGRRHAAPPQPGRRRTALSLRAICAKKVERLHSPAMSVTALEGREARRPVRLTWMQTVGAVIGGSLLAGALTLLWLFPLAALQLFPIIITDDATGNGWPWRIDGPWSVAADLGPLLLCGAAFAYGFEMLRFRSAGAPQARRPSVVLALVAAALGWVTVASPPNAGLIGINGLLAFLVLLVVARETAAREPSKLRLTRRGVALVVAAGVCLTAASLSYGIMHPLTVAIDPSVGVLDGRDVMHMTVRNDGRLDARIQSIEVPGLPVTRVGRDDERMTPVAGTRIDGHGDLSVQVAIAQCGMSTVDRVHVRLAVAGRELRQVVRLDPPVRLSCPS